MFFSDHGVIDTMWNCNKSFHLYGDLIPSQSMAAIKMSGIFCSMTSETGHWENDMFGSAIFVIYYYDPFHAFLLFSTYFCVCFAKPDLVLEAFCFPQAIMFSLMAAVRRSFFHGFLLWLFFPSPHLGPLLLSDFCTTNLPCV